MAGQRYSLRSQLHRIFTSAHADGCAEQCFEGVQFGSIIISSRSLDQRIATPLVGNDRDRSLNEVMAYLPPGSPCCKSTCPSYAESRAFFFKVLHRLLLARISHQTESLITDTCKQEKAIAAAWKGEHAAVYGPGLCCLYEFKTKDLRNQLDFQRLTQLIVHAQMRHTVFVIEASGCQRRYVRLIVL